MIILWILLTLVVASLSVVIAKKYGPEYIIGMYVAMAVIANVLAGAKIVKFFMWSVDAGTIVYGAMFLLTDMLSEIYGKKVARKAVFAGFLGNVMLVVSVWVALRWAGAPGWENQQIFETLFGNTWRIVLASLTAYLISQNLDINLYQRFKKMTRGRYMFFRNNASTWISQGVDTVIFTTIAFYGVFPIMEMIIGMYIVKVIIASFDTPFLYAAKWYYKK